MHRLFLFSALCGASVAAAHGVGAAECRGPLGLPLPGPERPARAGEVHYAPDHGLGCAVAADQGAAMTERKSPVTFLPCLHVGAVAIGDRRRQVETLLGAPAMAQEMDLLTDLVVYEVPQRTALLPRSMVTYREEQVVAVHLVGPPMDIPATFAGLVLGDGEQRVVDALGWPAQRCRLLPNGPETWTWPPFPIAIDMLDGVVAGVKMTWVTKK